MSDHDDPEIDGPGFAARTKPLLPIVSGQRLEVALIRADDDAPAFVEQGDCVTSRAATPRPRIGQGSNVPGIEHRLESRKPGPHQRIANIMTIGPRAYPSVGVNLALVSAVDGWQNESVGVNEAKWLAGDRARILR